MYGNWCDSIYMTIFLYSDKKYEQQSIACIKSLKLKIDDTIRIIYYTLGFKSEFTFNNLITQEYTPSREFYKLNFRIFFLISPI